MGASLERGGEGKGERMGSSTVISTQPARPAGAARHGDWTQGWGCTHGTERDVQHARAQGEAHWGQSVEAGRQAPDYSTGCSMAQVLLGHGRMTVGRSATSVGAVARRSESRQGKETNRGQQPLGGWRGENWHRERVPVGELRGERSSVLPSMPCSVSMKTNSIRRQLREI